MLLLHVKKTLEAFLTPKHHRQFDKGFQRDKGVLLKALEGAQAHPRLLSQSALGKVQLLAAAAHALGNIPRNNSRRPRVPERLLSCWNVS